MEFFQYDQAVGMDIRLKQCGWEQCESLHSYGPTARSFHLIHVITRGKGWFRRGNETYHLREGDGFIIYPGDITVYCADSEDPWEYYWLGFEGKDAPAMLALLGNHYELPIFQVQNLEFMKMCILRMYESVHQNAKAAMDAVGWAFLFLSNVTGEGYIASHIKPRVSRDYEYYSKAMWYIEGNHTRDLSIPEIANVVGLSRSALFRVFKKVANLSIQDAVINTRLATGCRLLQETSLPIQEVAFACGFNSAARFCQCFRRRYDMSPSTFRKKQPDDCTFV